MEKENKIYRKVGRKYEEIGYYFPHDYLTDGIWYVSSKPGSKRTTNGDYLVGMFKVSGKPVCDNFADYCALEDLTEDIMDDPDFKEIYNSDRGWSISDVVHKTIAILKKKTNKQ